MAEPKKRGTRGGPIARDQSLYDHAFETGQRMGFSARDQEIDLLKAEVIALRAAAERGDADFAKNRTPALSAGQFQAVMLALAELSLRRPGWSYMICVLITDCFPGGMPLFDQFRVTSSDIILPEGHEKDLLVAAGKRWMNSWGACLQHGLVESSHRCRDYDGQVFGPDGYAPQGYDAARPFLFPAK